MGDKVQGVVVPKWFLAVAVIAVLWNVLGLMAFVAQMMMTDAQMAELPTDQRTLFENMPMWVKVTFAVAVFAGTIGSVGLVMRQKWAMPVLLLSLFGVIGQQTYMFFLSNTIEVMGAANMVLPILVLIVAIALVWFSRRAISEGWLA
ncbi:MAG: hypothetical protein AB8B55_04085 [Mariniblastus sp.]